MATAKTLGKDLSLFYAFCSHHVGGKETAFSTDKLPLIQAFFFPFVSVCSINRHRMVLKEGKNVI